MIHVRRTFRALLELSLVVLYLLAAANSASAQDPDRPTGRDHMTEAELLTGEAIRAYHDAVHRAMRRERIGLSYLSGRPHEAGGAWEAMRGPECTGVDRECYGGDLTCPWFGNMCDYTAFVSDRRVLTDRLAELMETFPGSEAPVAQLVKFLMVDDLAEAAWAAAASCGAALWVCQALRGWVLHNELPGSGDAQLDSAVAAAPPGTFAFGAPPDPLIPDRGIHCEWRDPGHLVRGELAEELARVPCGEPAAAHDRFWWLADPLWSVSGNPRRGEHMVRNLRMRLEYERRRLHGEGGPLVFTFWHHPHARHPEWTREGFQNSWEPRSRMINGEEVVRAEPYVYGGYSFAPDADRYFDPVASTADDWAVTWDEGHERMITEEEWHNVQHHQTAVLRRGDRLRVASAAGLPVIVSVDDDVQGALAMGRPEDLSVVVAEASVDRGVVRAETNLDGGDWLASIEIQGDGWVGRARYGASAPVVIDGFGVSSPVLVEEAFEQGELALLDAILPTTDLGGLGRVGVYFEVYGVEADEPLEVALSTEREGGSIFRRFTNALRLTSDVALEVEWTEAAEVTSGEPFARRYLTVDLGGLAAGEYRLEVAVSRGDGTSASASRSIRVEG